MPKNMSLFFLVTENINKWRPIVDMFCNGNVEMDITLEHIQNAFSMLAINASM